MTPGFTEVYPWQAIHGTETDINWMKGQQLDILEVRAEVVVALSWVFVVSYLARVHQTKDTFIICIMM